MSDSQRQHFSDMVREIRIRTDVEKYVVEKVLKAFLEILGDWLLQKIEFNWHGFGTFTTKTSKGYIAKTLKQVVGAAPMEPKYIPPRISPILRYSILFKKKFRGGEDNA